METFLLINSFLCYIFNILIAQYTDMTLNKGSVTLLTIVYLQYNIKITDVTYLLLVTYTTSNTMRY